MCLFHMLGDPILQKGARKMMNNYGCVLPFFQTNQSQPICGSGTFPTLENKTAKDIWNDLFTTQKKFCTFPCKQMVPYFGIMDTYVPEINHKTKEHKRAYIKMYLKSTLKYTETVDDYPITTMLAGKVNMLKEFTNAMHVPLQIYSIFSFELFQKLEVMSVYFWAILWQTWVWNCVP